MNKTILFGMLIIVAIGVYFGIRPQNPAISDSTQQVASQNAQTANAEQRRYIPYSQSEFEAAKGKKRVLFFFAPWCPTCVPTDRAFQENPQGIPQDVVLFKTDYDSSGELKKKYGVSYQHTFVYVDDLGTAIKKWNGGGVQELVANTK